MKIGKIILIVIFLLSLSMILSSKLLRHKSHGSRKHRSKLITIMKLTILFLFFYLRPSASWS